MSRFLADLTFSSLQLPNSQDVSAISNSKPLHRTYQHGGEGTV